MKIARYLAGAILGFGLVTVGMADTIRTIGWIEHVQIQSENMLLTAKIDTGADNSSIDARDVEIYEHNGDKRVRFAVDDNHGNSVQFDQPLVRITHIKRKGTAPLERPVVPMELCVGDILKTTNVNLAKRKNFKYRMLIGRSYLKDAYLVNANQKFTAEPTCKGKALAMNEAR